MRHSATAALTLQSARPFIFERITHRWWWEIAGRSGVTGVEARLSRTTLVSTVPSGIARRRIGRRWWVVAVVALAARAGLRRVVISVRRHC